MVDLTPYSTVKGLMGPLDSWLGSDDAERLAAYAVYESIYRNVPQAFKLVQRGDESNPIYLPSAMTIVEAVNRYLAKRWTYALDPKLGTTGERAELNAMMDQLFRREQMWAKFATQKRWGLIRGDAVWHIRADMDKAPGTRISIDEVDPGSYFPILDDWNPEKLYGVHLVDPVVNEAGKTVIKRQTYRKTDQGTITYEVTWWEVAAWDDRDEDNVLKPIATRDLPEGQEFIAAYELDPRITSIPVYHVKNNRVPSSPFGGSEIAGFESIIAGANQSISDEDLSLALEGLGLYWTNSGPPVDEDGNETNWKLGPGWVVEVDEGAEFGRTSGVGSVTPYGDHIDRILGAAREAAGVPDIAIGNVDVATAESGIALAFKMSPILAKNEEKEQELLSVMDHLLYDLATMWFPVYEQLDNAARPVSIVDDPMPVDRAAVLSEVTTMLTNGIISIAYAQQILSEKLGYDFPDEMLAQIVEEQAALAQARNVDPFASRAAQELDREGA